MSDRIRRDPRRELEARRSRRPPVEATGSARPRVNPRDRRGGRPAAPPARPAPAPPSVLRLESPDHYVLAVVDLELGRLSRNDRDLLGAARRLAGESAAVVLLACLGPGETLRDDAGTAGADRVLILRRPAFSGYAPEARVAAVLAAAAALPARHLLFNETPRQGADLGRRVAARLGEEPAVACVALTGGAVLCLRDGGRSELPLAPPRLLLFQADSMTPYEGPPREGRLLDPAAFDPREIAEPAADEGLLPVDSRSLPLTEAALIVSAGVGVTDWAAFHALADALGAAEGGSRAVCDAGHLPRARQIGASGTLVEPQCYLAFGISGASQHLHGIAGCRRVVAVNTDLHADMVKRADLAIIADAQVVMPALTHLLRERRRRAA